ncbi:hypothetical protein GALMADRAFT_761122 [Galerina marginata CBS 339.88]|uniref:DUF6534 domain-containing protein n=1 Tax=Galerina marginata (strain CBS 339.88) TaxID=685588 RepID=A0A067SP07_GALM3|nr:hypothetical protein GALMADRAFT_761122 [Galerina marginata CBS 339.88]
MSSYIYVDLSDTIGALQIGSLFGVFLFGIVSLQAYNYYDTYTEDGWGNKLLVAGVWLLEIGHTLGISYDVYRSTITLYGEPQLLGTFNGITVAIVFGGAITLLVQAFFALRLARLFPGPYKYIGGFCVMISTLRFCATIYLTVVGFTSTTLEDYRHQVGWLVSTTFIVSATVDVVIAGSMLYYLTKKRGEAMVRISGIINRLVTYTIRSGLFTSVVAVGLVVCLQTMPANLIWLGVYTFIAKLYSNSLLSALNARREMREEMHRGSFFRGRKGLGQDTSFSTNDQVNFFQ